MIWKDDTLQLRPVCVGKPLQVAIWMDRLTGLPWVAEAIRTLRNTTGINLSVVFCAAHPPQVDLTKPFAYQLYERWNLSALDDGNPIRTVDLRPSLDGIAVHDPPDDPAQFKAWNLDVLICLSAKRLAGSCNGWTRFGVWTLGFSSPGESQALPAYFWEMQRGDTVSELVLYAHDRCFEEGRILYRYQAATRRGWKFAANAVEPLSMAPVILTRRLLDVQQHGSDGLTRLPSWRQGPWRLPLEGKAKASYPSAATLIAFFARKFVDRIRQRLVYARGEPKWMIYLRRDRKLFTAILDRFDNRNFLPVPNPPDSTFADPFVLQHSGRTYLFVEEIVTSMSRGHLSVCEVLPDGLSPCIEIMRRPFHISYPCVLEWNGEVYMIPETAENRTVELYRAAPFPGSWRLEKTLLSGVLLVDTTPFHHQGVWYFFTATVEEDSGNWLETWLFYSDRLDGEWNYHPQNPICSDVRRARSAGHLFYRNGKLIRPAQDCSICYGYAIVLNEVLHLSPTAYEEKPLEVIYPDWMPGIFATHTLNATAEIEVIDATRIPTA